MSDFPRRWGAYVLIRPLGFGGMGSVYLAATGRPGNEKLCVIKRLHAEDLSKPERLARFRREANIVRTLSHGGIPKTWAVDELDGEPFIVQEFIEGRTITQVLGTLPSVRLTLPPTLAIHVAREVARALGYSHRHGGIIHRDVAPDNVMLTFDGEVRLIDFGVARGDADSTLTAPGAVVGRHLYTAPEILAGQAANAQTDVYSVGMLFWELLTGHPPIVDKEEKLPLPSTMAKLPVPAGADTVFLHATEADPSRRLVSAEELQRSLGALLAPTFVGDTALAGLLAKCYDLERERKFLDGDIAEARRLLVEPATEDIPEDVDRVPTRGWTPILVGAGLLLAVAGGARALFHREHRPQGSTAPAARSPLVAAPPTAPPPAGELASAPTMVLPPETVARRPPAKSAAALGARRRPRSPVVSATLDEVMDEIGAHDLPTAETHVRQVLEQGSPEQRSRAHMLLARIHSLNGNRRAAEEELATAVRLDPQNTPAADQLAAFRHRGLP